MSNKLIYTSPDQVEKAFYEAFGRKNLKDMMGLWAEDEEITCVHPTGSILVGYVQVQQGWQQLFAKQTDNFSITVTLKQRVDGVMVASHQLIEEIRLNKEDQKVEVGHVLALNVFLRTPNGWRLIIHQAMGISESYLNLDTNKQRILH